MSEKARPASSARVALIDEALCVGCTLCIQACPFDAIVGAHELMHTVIAALCTGCDKCLPPCPMDCIAMVPATGEEARWTRERAIAARERRRARTVRLERDRGERAARLARRSPSGRQA